MVSSRGMPAMSLCRECDLLSGLERDVVRSCRLPHVDLTSLRRDTIVTLSQANLDATFLVGVALSCTWKGKWKRHKETLLQQLLSVNA